jgi:DNA mismatch repair protein MSH4
LVPTKRTIQYVEQSVNKPLRACLTETNISSLVARSSTALYLAVNLTRSVVTARYNAVEDLATKEDMFVSVRQALKGFIDADKVLTSE